MTTSDKPLWHSKTAIFSKFDPASKSGQIWPKNGQKRLQRVQKNAGFQFLTPDYEHWDFFDMENVHDFLLGPKTGEMRTFQEMAQK